MKEKIMIKAEHLKLYYGKICAVDDVSFSMYKGEILGVIGPNGSGKTSLIECLEGLRRPSDGKIEVFGYHPCKDRREIYKKMGIQLQEAAYPEKIKVKELCALFAAFYENPADWKLLLRQLGLEEKAGRMVNKLSGGEKQRLSILLALLPRPELLILDELTTGLDPEIRRGLWESLLRIKRAGTGILLVSHYMDEMEALADRLLFMMEGRCIFLGTKKEFRQYARQIIGEEKWSAQLSLEDIYLLLSPKTNLLTMEGIL